MEIPKGFKQTAVGILPDEWETRNIDNCCSIKARIGWQGLTKSEYLDHGDYLLITATDFENGFINWASCFYVSEERYLQDTNIQIQPGDVLISKDGTIGKVAFLPTIPKPGTLNSGVFVVRPKNGFRIDKTFLSLIFKSVWFKEFIDQLTAGSTIVHLYQKDFVKFNLVFPSSLDEQKRIAAAISDVDELIASFNQQIEKKRQIKEGAMQQLLTGKTRLPGFTEPWKQWSLGELLEYEQPTQYLVSSTEYVDNGIPVLTAGKSFILGYTNEDSGIYRKLPVIIFDDFVTSSKFVDFPFKAKSSAMKMLSLRDKKNNLRLIYEMMQLIDFPMTDHKRYWIAEYSKLVIKLPSQKEQNAIAQILSDMDEEIRQLEAERDKFTLVKQGMMQELLTGKTRLN